MGMIDVFLRFRGVYNLRVWNVGIVYILYSLLGFEESIEFNYIVLLYIVFIFIGYELDFGGFKFV